MCTTRVLAVFDFYNRRWACNLSECENPQNSDCPFRLLFDDFSLCSRQLRHLARLHSFVWFFCCYLPTWMFRNFTFNWRKKKLGKSPRENQTWYNLADGATALAQLYALLSYRARSFNQWLYVLYPNFIVTYSSESNFPETVLIVSSNWDKSMLPFFRYQTKAYFRSLHDFKIDCFIDRNNSCVSHLR